MTEYRTAKKNSSKTDMVTQGAPNPSDVKNGGQGQYRGILNIPLSLSTEKRCSIKEQLACKRDNAITLPSGRGAIGTLSRSEELENNLVYITTQPKQSLDTNQKEILTSATPGSTSP